jgi:hypothetical protein
MLMNVDRSPVVGSDGSGLVEVGLDAAGRVAAVEVHRDWARRLGPELLGPAVVAAAADATARSAPSLAPAGPLSAGPLSAGPVPAGPVPAGRLVSGPLVSGPRAIGSDGLRDLLSTLDAALAEVDVLVEGLVAVNAGEVVGAGASGRVSVTITGSRLAGVTFDRGWLADGPTGRQVGGEIEAACRSAYATVDRERAAAEARAPHVAEVLALVSDPGEFVRRLGLG